MRHLRPFVAASILFVIVHALRRNKASTLINDRQYHAYDDKDESAKSGTGSVGAIPVSISRTLTKIVRAEPLHHLMRFITVDLGCQ